MPTKRQEIIELLEEQEMNGLELSGAVQIREKEVYDHLDHIARSLSSRGKRLQILPFSCLACGYTFKERRKFQPPGRCPKCKDTHLEMPEYRIL